MRQCITFGCTILLLSSTSGCWLMLVGMGSQVMVSEPPTDKAEARKWWQDTLASVDQATLRCWLQASEYHRQTGSSAWYCRHDFLGHNMLGPVQSHHYMPAPIPPEFLEAALDRVTDEKLDDKEIDRAKWAMVSKCKGCTTDQAREAWTLRQK